MKRLQWIVMFWAAWAQAEADAPHVRGLLLAEVERVAPGDSFDVLFHQDIDPGWHTYWINPGDSGAPPTFEWDLPDGVRVGDFRFPWPERIPYGPLMNFGYHDRVDLPFSVAVDRGFEARSLTITGRGQVLVCADICIPEKMELALTLPVGATVFREEVSARFTAARARIPTRIDVGSRFSSRGDDITLTLDLPGMRANRITRVDYFPLRADLIDNPAPQTFRLDDDGLTLTLKRGFDFDPARADLSGVLVIAEDVGAGLVSSYRFDAGPPGATSPERIGLLAALVFAFLGGLILNLMPCVFPVLSIKVLSLVESVHAEGGSIGLHGLAYAAGVVASFLAIAIVLVALRAGGEAIGWGFQLQSPVVVALLAYLFLVIGLNLLGVFEVGYSLMSLGGRGQASGYTASVLTGVLATVVAAPCTAPFMGAALGYALLESPIIGLGVFAALGVGMAAPYVLLCFSPALLDRLPGPGNWMLVLKQVLAFPMFASGIWLLWVLGIQAGATAMMQVLSGGLAITLAIWLLNLSARFVFRSAAVLLVLGALYIAAVQETQPADAASAAGQSEAYSEAALDLAIREGPVFVNFTAAWCITCKVNEINALSVPSVREAFAESGVTYLKADWTNEDPAITRALQVYGRTGVPLYLLYRKNAARAQVLPQILTPQIVLDALGDL